MPGSSFSKRLVSALAMFSSMAGRSQAGAWSSSSTTKSTFSRILSGALAMAFNQPTSQPEDRAMKSWDNMTVEERVEHLKRLVEQIQGDVEMLKHRTPNPATF
jgi:hypothetical protein